MSLVASQLRLRQVRGVTRVVDCVNELPLKMLQPHTGRGTARVVLSSYGGGMVQGDQVRLDIHAEADTRLHLATQANSRVYRNTNGEPARQVMQGQLDSGSRVVIHNDPLVPHADSVLEQEQNWDLAADANLVLMDWLVSGRSDSGESFAFDSYVSRVRVTHDGKPVLLDSLQVKPNELNPRSSARFGFAGEGFLNIYFIGTESQALARNLDEITKPNDVHKIEELQKYPRYPGRATVRSMSHLTDRPVSILRSTGRTRADYSDLLAVLFGALADDAWLGFNPLNETR